MSLDSLRVCGTGSHAVIVENLNMSQKQPEWVAKNRPGGKRIYKISTSGASHFREVRNAAYLDQLDPEQRYFVYPIKSYNVTADPKLLQYIDDRNPVPQKCFDRNATRMFIDVVPYAGLSLKRMKKDGIKFTANQAKIIISSLINGLIALHKRGLGHGDAHEHNVIVQMQPDGKVLARWIDFSEMRMRDDLQGDVKRFINVIKFVLAMVPAEETDDQLDAMYSTINRGVPPMSALSLHSDIAQYLRLTATTKRSKASSSSSASKSRVRKTLKY